MTEQKQVYRCNICGNMVEVVHIGTGRLVCCGQQMQQLEEKSGGTGPEKHIPVVEKTDKGVKVKIGSISHPMEENHCIEWIEITADSRVYRKTLKPGEKPEAEFNIELENIDEVSAREYCSIHGLWESA
ncbi:desulfoferrodoxin [Methanobacterium sp.]|uniref:desulfoferrodoxin n=1 Tax=Methanobacterium sp. TaxID=2164 RepID=UPI003C77E321